MNPCKSLTVNVLRISFFILFALVFLQIAFRVYQFDDPAIHPKSPLSRPSTEKQKQPAENCSTTTGQLVKNNLISEGYAEFLPFRQPLKSNCPYHGPDHGLFPPETPHPRYIITGGAGFIGSNLVKALIASGVKPSQIKIIDNLWRGRLANFQTENGSWVVDVKRDFCAIDLRNKVDTMRYIRAADYVYHLAVMYVGDYGTENGYERSVYADNTMIDSNVLLAAETNGIRNFIYASSLTVPLYELSYDRSKQWGEKAALDSTTPDFKVAVVRLPHVFGPHSDYSKHSFHPIPSTIYAVIKKLPSYYDLGYSDAWIGLLPVHQAVQSLLQAATTMSEVINVEPFYVIPYDSLIQEILSIMDVPSMVSSELVCGAPVDGITPPGVFNASIPDYLRTYLALTIEWMKKDLQHPRIMTFLIGEPRGGEIAWKSLYHNLLQPYNSHLTTYFTKTSHPSLVEDQAQFSWRDDQNYEGYMDQASALCNGPDKLHYWHKICQLGGNWIGGIEVCKAGSSAGIVQVFRWLIIQQIFALNMLNQYDIFILTRADHFYPCKHIPFEGLEREIAWIVWDEGYDGYCDRHLIGHGVMFFKMINTVQRLVCETDHMFEILSKVATNLNVEGTQKVSWDDMKLPVKTMPRTYFAVKLPKDPTAWAVGDAHPITSKFDGLLVKYINELIHAVEFCKVDLEQEMTKMRNSQWPRINLP